MSDFLGIDTSNYTTSAALYQTENGKIQMKKQLLPVGEGALGLRQSDAVFHHVKQLPVLLAALTENNAVSLSAVGVSTAPRRTEGSYMPCFLAGDAVASSLSSVLGIPKYAFSHQEGHIMAALYSAGRMDFLNQEFYAFHVSGGTTECLLVRYCKGRFDIHLIAKTLDLKAGQAVDRVGVMLGLPFPAGRALDALACGCKEQIRVKPTLKGADCSLSGVENRCKKLFEKGADEAYIAKYCILSIQETLSEMTKAVLAEHGPKPLLYAGGVMSNSMIRSCLEERFAGVFAQPDYSSDNAAGLALLAAYADQS